MRCSAPRWASQRTNSASTSAVKGESRMAARLAWLPSPFLNKRNRPDLSSWLCASSMSWCRSPSTTPIPTGCRPASICARRPGDGAARRARRPPAWSGRRTPTRIRACTTGSRTSRRSSTFRRSSRNCASFVDWVANYTLSARGMVLRMALRMGEHLGPGARARRRAARRPAAGAHDRRRACGVLELLADGMARAKAKPRRRPASASA